MDRQATYNTIRAHLLAMDKPAGKYRRSPGWTTQSFACSYLDEEGRKCAIGVLIPDGHPGQQFQGAVASLLAQQPDLVELWGVDSDNPYHYDHGDDVDFLTALQRVHDKVPDSSGFGGSHWGPEGLNADGRQALDDVASHYGLAIEQPA